MAPQVTGVRDCRRAPFVDADCPFRGAVLVFPLGIFFPVGVAQGIFSQEAIVDLSRLLYVTLQCQARDPHLLLNSMTQMQCHILVF